MLTDQEIEFLEDEMKHRARRSFKDFVIWTKPDYDMNWHHELLAKKLEQFAQKKIKRLMVFMPPRHGKSELVSRRLPAYIFGRNPKANIIGASYAESLASSMNRDIQRVIDSDEYAQLFPNVTLNQSNVRTTTGSWLRNNDVFEIVDHGGRYRSAGIGSGITGVGADYLIIDDPIKDQSDADSKTKRDALYDWYASTAYTRLAKDGCILITVTRWHEDDLPGRLLAEAKANPDADQWEVLSLPAIKEDDTNADDTRQIGDALWPNMFNVDALNKIKHSVGSRVWNSLYQQRPTATEGGIVKRNWIKYYRALPRLDRKLISVDATFKETQSGSFVCFQAWGEAGPDAYLVDQIRARMDFPSTIKALEAFCAKHRDAYIKLIEEKANGAAIIATLKSKIPGIVAVNPEGSKEARLSSCSPMFEAGNVLLPDPSIAPWIGDYVEEIVTFPNSTHDDQADTTSQALDRIKRGGFDMIKKLITL